MADDSLFPDSLQDYFDDLLLDTPNVPGESVEPVRQRMAKPAPADMRPVQELSIKPVEKASLERLLSSRPRPVEVKSDNKPVVTPVKMVPAPAVSIKPDVVEAKVAPAPPVTTPAVEAPELEPESTDAFAGTDQSLEALQWQPNGRPRWAQERFDVLLFDVSGLTLAVPLVALGQIQPITEELTPLFGQADWFMGLLPTPMGKLRTVNTALFVMPERYDDKFVKTAKYVVSIDGLPWGLAVNSVNQPTSLDPDAVKWRTERSKRPWLAGTVKEHMCALIDIPMMGRMLLETDKNLQKNKKAP